MPGASIYLNRMGPAAKLRGSGGTVIVDQGRLVMQGDYVLEVCGVPSNPLAFGSNGNMAFVVAEGSNYRLLESSTLDFTWPGEVRLGDSSDLRAPWLRFRGGRLRQVPGLATAMVGLNGVAVSLIGDGADPGDDLLLFPYRRGKDTRRLSRPLHPDFPSASGYFLYPLDSGMGIMLGRVSTRANISHAEALEIVLTQNKVALWFKLSDDLHGPSSFLARSSAPRGISLTASTPGAGGILAAANPGEAGWNSVDLSVENLFSVGGRLRVARDDATQTKGFTDGQVWLARAAKTTPVGDATGLFTPTDRLELDIELPLEADIARRLPEMSLTYRDREFGKQMLTRAERHYGVRVAGLADRSGGAVALDAVGAQFMLSGTHASPSIHITAGVGPNSILVPKLIDGAHERRIEIAAGDLSIVVSAPAAAIVTALQLDTKKSLFTLMSPTLIAAPVGVTSGDGARDQTSYKRWSLRPRGPDPKLELKLTAAGLRANGDWVSRFKTADPAQTYSAIDHPGLGITIDGVPRTSLSDRGQVETSFTISSPNGGEIVVYSAFVALLGYVGARRIGDGNWEFLDPYLTLLKFNKLDDGKYVKNASVKGLQVIYLTDGAGATDGLHDFIESNRASSEHPNAPEYFWPFTMGLAVPLRSEKSGTVAYADDIIHARHPTLTDLKPAIAFDMSAEAALESKYLGWGSWDDLAIETPALWPRANNGLGAHMDPSVPEWRGIVMRDLPLELAVNAAALAKMPKWAQDLVATINKNLVLEYAYRDEAGVTWKGGAKGLPQLGDKISPSAWDGVFEIWYHDLTVLGAANAVRSADCEIEFVLPKLKTKNPLPGDPDDSLRLRGKFGLDLDNDQNPVTRVDIRQDRPSDATDSIPGFESIALKRVSTDFQTVMIEVELVASATLAQALPFLAGPKPQRAFLAFNLKGPPAAVFELSLPSETDTNLFGRWPLKVQSMRLGWGNGADIKLEVTGRISLGLAGFSSVGATVEVTKLGAALSFDVRLNDVGVDLSLAGVNISGRLGWGDADPAQTKVAFADIVKPRVKDRDIRGSLSVDGGGFLGDNQVSFRAGNQGEVNYWVAAAVHKGDDSINLGFGQLKNPGFLIAHNADLNNNLRNLAVDPGGALFAKLRPTGGAVWDWLNSWNASSSVGTVLAASGFFMIDEVLVKVPVKDTEITPVSEKLLSGVLWIDTGVLRVDGVASLITDKAAYFGMAVDFVERTFMASFQTDPIVFGRYTFQPGRMAVGFGFGERKYLEVHLGWPPKIGEYERDWTQALHFHLPELPPPVNAGWGGLKGVIKDDVITVGVAFRVGWMRGEGDARGGSGGGFSIGYAVGGLIQFSFAFRAADCNSPILAAKDLAARTNSRSIAYATVASTALERLESLNQLSAEGELFGDVWGSAWLRFMGITLASIDLKGFARYRIIGSLDDGVTDARGTCGFSVSVTIMCVKYTCDARYDIVCIDGGHGVVAFDETWIGRLAPPQAPASKIEPLALLGTN